MRLTGSSVLKGILTTTITVLVIHLGPAPSEAAPKADLWSRWLGHREGSTLRVDHSRWGGFLSRYLTEGKDGVNRVAYGAVTPEDRGKLNEYLTELAGTPVRRLNRKEQLAYWINFYNALTLKVVLDHYPVKSIMKINISPGWFSRGPWGKKLTVVEGERISLDDIEHRILRPIWLDPRIHYAVHCASLGCPNLAPVPYTADTVDTMLSDGARKYVNHPRGASVTEEGLVVSSIYTWFKENFGGTDRGVIAHLKKFASPALASKLEGVTGIYDDRYDWRLNDSKFLARPQVS